MINQKVKNKFNKRVAECVGLWLAEGDKKTSRELTFTNNCFELILFFHDTIKPLYKGKNKPRIYIYSPTDRVLVSKLNDFVIRNYVDKRANRTYFIYRLADVKFIKRWKVMVNSIKNQEECYSSILRGIFAGEGNIKHDFKNNNSRSIRIASGLRDAFIEKLLIYFNIKFSYEEHKRQYVVTGRFLDKLKEIKMASLHPEKEAKFSKMFASLKEKHYSPGELNSLIFFELDQFKTTFELSKKFRKSHLRVLEVLCEMKKENKIGNIKRDGNSYWIKKELMDTYLYKERIKLLKQVLKNKNMTAIGKSLNLSRKTIRNRLVKLEQEGLVEKKGGFWVVEKEGKTLVGIDESGSEQ
jgi:hypothetical protein